MIRPRIVAGRIVQRVWARKILPPTKREDLALIDKSGDTICGVWPDGSLTPRIARKIVSVDRRRELAALPLTLHDVHRVANDRVLSDRTIGGKWHRPAHRPVIRLDVVDLCRSLYLSVVAETPDQVDLPLVVPTAGPIADVLWHRGKDRVRVGARTVTISDTVSEKVNAYTVCAASDPFLGNSRR